jgi:hypothetical protein
MLTFESPILGLSFRYPAPLGDVQLAVVSGETGEGFYGTFDRYNALLFEGRSPDFSQGRGGQLGDTIGFGTGPDGRYMWRTIPDPVGSRIVVDEVIRAGDREVLVLGPGFTEAEWPDLAAGQHAALVNLSGELFPGMIMLNLDESRLPHATFLAILRTMAVFEPEPSR